MSAEQIEKEARMRACHERNEALRARARRVVLNGEQPYYQKGQGTYRESKTAKMLREKYAS